MLFTFVARCMLSNFQYSIHFDLRSTPRIDHQIDSLPTSDVPKPRSRPIASKIRHACAYTLSKAKNISIPSPPSAISVFVVLAILLFSYVPTLRRGLLALLVAVSVVHPRAYSILETSLTCLCARVSPFSSQQRLPDVVALQEDAVEEHLKIATAQQHALKARLESSESRSVTLSARLSESNRQYTVLSEELREAYAALKATARKRTESAELLLVKGRECVEKQRALAAAACQLKVTEWKVEGLARLLAATEEERTRDKDARAEAELMRSLVRLGKAEVEGIRWELAVRCEEADELRARLAQYESSSDGSTEETGSADSRAAERAGGRRRGERTPVPGLPSIVISSPPDIEGIPFPSTEATRSFFEVEDEDDRPCPPNPRLLTVPPPSNQVVDEPPRPGHAVADSPPPAPALPMAPHLQLTARLPRGSWLSRAPSLKSRRLLPRKKRPPTEYETSEASSEEKPAPFWARSFRRRNKTLPDLRHSWA